MSLDAFRTMSKPAYTVAVIGATGLVGTEIVSVLEQRQFPVADLQLYASLRSAGAEMRCGDLTALVQPLDEGHFEGADIALLAAGEQVSAESVERVSESGAVIIDTSQLFAGEADVPVIVPEVNAPALVDYINRRLVVSPDAPAIALAVVLKPLQSLAAITRLVVSTYEPVSGAGRAGIDELQRQTVDLMNGRSTDNEIFPQRIAFNLLPQIGEFLAGGVSHDECRTVSGLRRILNEPDCPMSITRVRAPLFYGTGLTVHVATAETISAAQARELLAGAPGIFLQDDVVNALYPTPAGTVGQDAVYVGRIRADDAANALDFWVTIDNVRKGAAVNAVQVAELLVRDYL